MYNEPNMKPATYRLPPELIEWLKQEAKRRQGERSWPRITASTVVRDFLLAGKAKAEEKAKKTAEKKAKKAAAAEAKK